MSGITWAWKHHRYFEWTWIRRKGNICMSSWIQCSWCEYMKQNRCQRDILATNYNAFPCSQLATRLCRNGHWTGTPPICSTNSNFCIGSPTLFYLSPIFSSNFSILNHHSLLPNTTRHWACTPFSITRTGHIWTWLHRSIPLPYWICYGRISTC